MDQTQNQAPRLTRRNFLKALGGMAAGAAAAGLGGWTYITRIEPEWFDTVSVNLALPRLSPAFRGFRLVQISDIHLSDVMTGALLTEVGQSVLALKPDLVAITGDFVDKRRHLRDNIQELKEGLSQLAGQVQVVAVMGNHDYWTGVRQIREVLESLNILELRNRAFTLERRGERFHIAGVDDPWEGQADLSGLIRDLQEDGAAVLLAHEPDYADVSSRTGRFDLQLSGHSHGGQVVLPLVGPPILPYEARRYPSGLYQVSQMYQYTNRGLGTTSPHVRFNCRPEITLFTFS